MMRAVWVIGMSGMLGSALCAAILAEGSTLFAPRSRFNWSDAEQLAGELERAASDFNAFLANADCWEIYWAAGVGAMSSTHTQLAAETRALEILLSELRCQSRTLARPGLIGFSSSAGAIYAGSSERLITEVTEAAPTTDYAREKLVQEALLERFSSDASVVVLLARLSTLYGHRPHGEKGQGLLAHMARRIIRHEPLHIYVPFDTMRDYLSVEDAARAMIANARAVKSGQGIVVKIIASERSTTIAEIIHIFKRASRRKPLIVTSSSRLSALYTRCIQFKSIEDLKATAVPATSLAVGISRLLNAERALHGRVSDSALRKLATSGDVRTPRKSS